MYARYFFFVLKKNDYRFYLVKRAFRMRGTNRVARAFLSLATVRVFNKKYEKERERERERERVDISRGQRAAKRVRVHLRAACGLYANERQKSYPYNTERVEGTLRYWLYLNGFNVPTVPPRPLFLFLLLFPFFSNFYPFLSSSTHPSLSSTTSPSTWTPRFEG